MNEELKNDVAEILSHGPVAISDLRKQLIGVNCTCIKRVWSKIPSGHNFQAMVESAGFTTTDSGRRTLVSA